MPIKGEEIVTTRIRMPRQEGRGTSLYNRRHQRIERFRNLCWQVCGSRKLLGTPDHLRHFKLLGGQSMDCCAGFDRPFGVGDNGRGRVLLGEKDKNLPVIDRRQRDLFSTNTFRLLIVNAV
jgi:hypothetical protein